MAIFGIGLLVDGYHRPGHWYIYFLVYHDFIQFLTVMVDTNGQYSKGSIFDMCLAYLAKRLEL